MQVTVGGIQETFENPQVVESLAVRGRSECGGMITRDCQGDFACPSLNAAAMNRENNFLGLRIVGRLGFRELTPFCDASSAFRTWFLRRSVDQRIVPSSKGICLA